MNLTAAHHDEAVTVFWRRSILATMKERPEYLDIRNLRGEAKQLTGAQLARRFGVIVDRATWVDVDEIIDDPADRRNENLPDYRDSIGVVLDGVRELCEFVACWFCNPAKTGRRTCFAHVDTVEKQHVKTDVQI